MAVLITVVGLAAGCGDGDGDGVTPGPDVIEFSRLNLQPEGVEFDSRRGRFLVGSLTGPEILIVGDDGALSPLTTDVGLVASVGIHVDPERDVLAVAGNFGLGMIGVALVDLESGETTQVVDLREVAGPGFHLANDLVTDGDGNIYVTDTQAPNIYRIDAAGQATIFASDDRFNLLNGIELDEDAGALVVATLSGPDLFRVSLGDPTDVTTIDAPFPITGDGIVFRPNGELAIVGAARQADGTVAGTGVTTWASDDGWRSARVVAHWVASELPTTAAVRGDDVHVVYAGLFETERSGYSIVKAQLAP